MGWTINRWMWLSVLGSSHTSDFKIGTPVATLPGAWRYRVSTGTGRPGVSILWLDEVESLICNFYLSVAARKIEQIRPWDTLACCWDVKQPTNKQTLCVGCNITQMLPFRIQQDGCFCLGCDVHGSAVPSVSVCCLQTCGQRAACWQSCCWVSPSSLETAGWTSWWRSSRSWAPPPVSRSARWTQTTLSSSSHRSRPTRGPR